MTTLSQQPLLAHMATLRGDLRVYWNAKKRSVTIHTANDVIEQPDGPIGLSIAAALDSDPAVASFDLLQFYELPYRNYWADDKTARAFPLCAWSDFANDHIAVQCRVVHHSSANVRRALLEGMTPLALLDALQTQPLCACLRSQPNCVCR